LLVLGAQLLQAAGCLCVCVCVCAQRSVVESGSGCTVRAVRAATGPPAAASCCLFLWAAAASCWC
jgi:hypothetical protein